MHLAGFQISLCCQQLLLCLCQLLSAFTLFGGKLILSFFQLRLVLCKLSFAVSKLLPAVFQFLFILIQLFLTVVQLLSGFIKICTGIVQLFLSVINLLSAIGKLLLCILQLFIDRTKYLLIDLIDLILSDDDIYTFLDQTGGTG